MLSRRELLQVAAATAAVLPHASTRSFAQQRLTQAELLAFAPLGNVTLLHVTDVHGQLMPVHFREPSSNIGVGDAKGQPTQTNSISHGSPWLLIRNIMVGAAFD